MSLLDHLRCPHCDRALYLPDAAVTVWVVCPGCRGRFPNPALPEDGSAPTDDRGSSAVAIDNHGRLFPCLARTLYYIAKTPPEPQHLRRRSDSLGCTMGLVIRRCHVRRGRVRVVR